MTEKPIEELITVEKLLNTDITVEYMDMGDLETVAGRLDVGEVIGLINQLGDDPIRVCYALLRIKASIDLLYNAITNRLNGLKHGRDAYKSELMLLFGQKDNAANPLVAQGIRPTVQAIEAAVLEDAGYQAREVEVTRVNTIKQSLYSVREVVDEEIRLINSLLAILGGRGSIPADLISKESLESVVSKFEEIHSSQPPAED